MNKAISIRQDEIDNLHNAARKDIFLKRLKFVKGDYLIDKEVIKTDGQYLVYPKSWTKEWIKWSEEEVVDRSPKLYVVANGENPPERDELDDNDKSKWPEGPHGKNDPWQLVYYLALENLKTGDVLSFSTPSVGGHKAVAEIVDSYTRRTKQIANCGQPIVELNSTYMPTGYGKTLRPFFKVVTWDDPASNFDMPERLSIADEMNDEIPDLGKDDLDDIPFDR